MVIPVFSLADHTALTGISRFSVSEPPRRSGSLTHLRVICLPLSPRLLILFRTLFMLANSLRIGFSRSTVSARAFCTTMSRHAEVSKIGILGTQPASHIVLTFQGLVKWFHSINQRLTIGSGNCSCCGAECESGRYTHGQRPQRNQEEYGIHEYLSFQSDSLT